MKRNGSLIRNVLGERKQINCEEENQIKKKRMVIGSLRKKFCFSYFKDRDKIIFFERRDKSIESK